MEGPDSQEVTFRTSLIQIITGGDRLMKSFMASPSTITRDWYVVDATGHTLGLH